MRRVSPFSSAGIETLGTLSPELSIAGYNSGCMMGGPGVSMMNVAKQDEPEDTDETEADPARAAEPASPVAPVAVTVNVSQSTEVQLPPAPKGLLGEFWDFIVHEKVWWMTPIVIVLVAMVAFILF